MLALFAPACGKAEHEAGAAPAVELPCGLEPAACLDLPALEIPGRRPLTASTVNFSATLEPTEYLETETTECRSQLVFDVGPDDLTGETIMIRIDWARARLAGVDCSHYDATVHVYGRSSNGTFSLVDYRVFGSDEKCLLNTLRAGVGDGRLSSIGPNIFLTPTRHPLGLRVVVAVLDACVPTTLNLDVAEQFP